MYMHIYIYCIYEIQGFHGEIPMFFVLISLPLGGAAKIQAPSLPEMPATLESTLKPKQGQAKP